jgi:hypothetical protein
MDSKIVVHIHSNIAAWWSMLRDQGFEITHDRRDTTNFCTGADTGGHGTTIVISANWSDKNPTEIFVEGRSLGPFQKAPDLSFERTRPVRSMCSSKAVFCS